MSPTLTMTDASVAYGSRTLWSGLDLNVEPGEFVAVLGPNGAGKTTLFRVLLGQLRLRSGSAQFQGGPIRRGSTSIGYIPQQKSLDSHAKLRGRDLVRFGLDGHKWGIGLPSRRARAQVDQALAAVGASAYADRALQSLSGGEQQRLRVAQALVTDPVLLLCDEPLQALDITHQQSVSALINQVCHERQIATLFITHELNPVLPFTDTVVYFANGRAVVGRPDEVMTTEVLSELYQSHIEVLHHDGRLLVLGAEEAAEAHAHGHHHGEDSLAGSEPRTGEL